MKIVVNTRLLLKDKLEGIGWFTYETLKRITQQHSEHKFVFVFDRKFNDEFVFGDNITPVVLSPQARHPFLYYLWFEISFPSLLKKHRPDLFLSPDGYLSLKTDTKSLSVIHDINYEHYPNDLPLLERKYYKYYFPRFAAKAARIATVSEFSKQDIVEHYRVPATKIDVVYNGINELFKPIDKREQQTIRKKFSDGKPYFLFVGALHPRKNLINLFKAFDLFKTNDNQGIKLLIVGVKKWWTIETQNTFDQMQHKADVVFCGRKSNKELSDILASSLALTFVSYFEGFGIPIIEAMKCEVPVITSNITSMPEVAHDAALLVDPFSIESISEAMNKIANDKNLCQQLVSKGIIRSQDFSWQRSADLLWNSMMKCVEEK